MKPRMERDLRDFSELAKQSQKAEAEAGNDQSSERQSGADESLSRLSGAIDWHMEQAARHQQTDIEIQKGIFDLQKEKQEVMTRLRERMACLDNPDCRPDYSGRSRPLEFDEDSGEFSFEGEPVSFSEMATDLEWGIGYDLGKHEKARLLTRKYYLEQAKDNLRDLLDRQITRSEVGNRVVHESKKNAYLAHEEDVDSGMDMRRSGFVAEKMVKNILKKASLDDDRLPFEVLDADIYQDVEEKIDFVIRHKERNRGVNVDSNEGTKDIAIQFSINQGAESKKRRQVKRAKLKMMNRGDMDDLVLVVLPAEFVNGLRKNWEEAGRPPGGPDKMMNQEQARGLFFGVMKDIMSDTELQETWSKVSERFHV